MGGSSGSPQPSSVTQNTSNLPEYARPYFEDLMGRAQAESNREYTLYKDPRLAGFNANQTDTQKNVMGMTGPTQYGTATNLSTAAGLASLNAGNYQTGNFSAQQIGLPQLNQYSMGPAQQVQGQQYDALSMGPAQQVQAQQFSAPSMAAAQSDYRPDLEYFQMTPTERIAQQQQYAAPEMGTARTDYQAQLQQYQMAGPEQFGQLQVDKYMSPYIQNVVDVQKREAITDAKKAQLMQNLGAARQGTFGGARQLLAGTERERALGQQMGDIQAKGLQSAYENAQQQFERDRAAGMSVGQANLQSQLQTQQLGTQVGLQAALANLSSEQQANVQNQMAQLQTQGLNADQALKVAMANQQAGLTEGQANLQANLQTQGLKTQTEMQMALANLSNQQQANVQNQAAALQTQGLNAQQAMQAALANQQAGLTVGQQNLVAGLQTQGLNAQQAMQAALANQQAGLTVGQQNLQSALQTQQLGTEAGLRALTANQQADLQRQQMLEQSRQFGGSLGLQGAAQANQAAQTLTNIGGAQQQSDLQRYQAQMGVGAQQQALEQQRLDMAYADFLRQRDYPMERLGYLSNMLRGVPIGLSSTQTTYAAPPSAAAQIGGAGLGAASVYNMLKG